MKNEWMKLIKQRFLFKSRGYFLSFGLLPVQIFMQQNILGGHNHLVKMIKNAGGERVKRAMNI